MRRLITEAEMWRIMSRVAPEPNSGCWLYTGDLNAGYGYLRVVTEGIHERFYVHVALWEYAWNRSIPSGYELDHLCRVRQCVYLRHLQTVTHAENQRRAAEARRYGPGYGLRGLSYRDSVMSHRPRDDDDAAQVGVK